ncbi:hypothetical protein Q9L58_006032 [Maublancomyces gigas]|uniref:Aminoacyl-transfer RNA synthetases class-II family profile domain-containing protein n=1 Tax=Discina gigas TaxID=1032678 RepID=A0ABR3GGP7_9PEZI
MGRKFRDERRPRAGLLRGREFTMKDLYTFDLTEASALETYHEVQGAYRAFFDDLKLPYIVAEADSGKMGGSLSHEYHYPSASGEDTILSCTACSHTFNEEAACAMPLVIQDPADTAVFHGITHDRKTLLNVFYPKPHDSGENEIHVNVHKIKAIIPDFDPSVGASALELYFANFSEYKDGKSEIGTYSQIINLFDLRLPRSVTESSFSNHSDQPIFPDFIMDKRIPTTSIVSDPATDVPLNLLKIKAGDACPKCEAGRLTMTSAVELGHTFHLGTRYSEPLKAVVANEKREWTPVEMGCHGIGLSRMISAVAEGYRDENGLCWPRVAAPFEVVVTYKGAAMEADAEEVYDILSSRGLEGADGVDVLLDDRQRDLVWKMKDADLVGYPVMVVLGRGWSSSKKVEVQVRKTRQKVEVSLGELKAVVEGFLKDL